MALVSECLSSGPYVIGATGGSGTRVVARIARHGGLFIGANLNVSEDALVFGRYSDRWINVFMPTGWASPVPDATEAEMRRDLDTVLEAHLAPLGEPASPWGWKEPRSIYLLPFFHSRFPGLKFLHVVRDGRDMAFSKNQNQLRFHGDAVLGPAPASPQRPLRSIALWSRINLLAAAYGDTRLRGRYLRVRFEDLCVTPVPIIRQIFEFLGLRGDADAIAGAEVQPPASLGRWQREDAATVAELHRIGGPALAAFGYGTPRPVTEARTDSS